MTEISVCIGSSCHLKGAYNIIQTFQQLIEEHRAHDEVSIKASFCKKSCENEGVAISIGAQKHRISPENARDFFHQNVLAGIPETV